MIDARADLGRERRPRLSRRCVLALAAATAGFPIVSTRAASPTARGVDVTAYGADPTGRRDSSVAFRSALAQSTHVYVPAGIYMVGDVQLTSNASITGVGESSILKQLPQARFVFTADSSSADLLSNLREIRLANLQLRGSCDRDGFSQFVHLVSLNGVSDVSIDNVLFRGFRGDGLYIGSGNVAGLERHNTRVSLRNCVFDGLNRQNRNGISVIDCDGFTVEACRFLNTTRADMPGAIDLEPDGESFHAICNVRISGNRFTGIGGQNAVISVYFPRGVLAAPTNIVVEDNTFVDVQATAWRFEQWSRAAPSSAQPLQCTFRRNIVTRCAQRPFLLRGLAGALVSGNRFSETKQAAQIGFDRPQDAVSDVAVSNNVFTRCGSGDEAGLIVFSATDVRFENNRWSDCGSSTRISSAVRFAGGLFGRVSFKGNVFESPAHVTTMAVSVPAGQQFEAGGNLFAKDNQQMDGLRNNFASSVR